MLRGRSQTGANTTKPSAGRFTAAGIWRNSTRPSGFGRIARLAISLFVLACLGIPALMGCSGSQQSSPVLNLAGNWEGLVTGSSGSAEISLEIVLDEHGRATASLSIPTMPNLDEATGWGRAEGGSISLALTDKARRGVFLTGKADSILAEITGQIVVSDSSGVLTFSVFRQ